MLHFRCADDRCIPGAQRCNGVYDCPDFSDEDDCNSTCQPNEFRCPKQNLCISKMYLCDGDNDCADGSDEMNCTCLQNQFRCDDGRCIEKRWRCDGWMDCFDYSDESIELCSGISCGRHAFRCRNKRCIQKSALCDGNDDCGDKSDEKNCGRYNKCSSNQFQCERDQFCISEGFHCDGESNCVDDSDEINCKEPVCNFGACSHICLEKKTGHYNCRCADGYVKGIEKNSTCVALQEPILLIASETNLRYLLPQKHINASSAHGMLPLSATKIDTFDVMILQDRIVLYWIDMPYRKIQKIVTKLMTEKTKRQKRAAFDQADTIVRATYPYLV